jgi:hypothetical protein
MGGHSFIRVRWIHASLDDPVELWSELDQERFEVRKVEIWQNGRTGFASPDQHSEGTMLSEKPVPRLDAIAADPQFEPTEISKLEFEQCWRANVR